MAHTLGSTSTRTSGATSPITTAAFATVKEDTVLILFLKVNGGTDRTGGAPTFAGRTMTQASTTQKAASSPEASCELWYLLRPPIGTSYVCVIPNAGSLTVFYTIATGRAAPGGSSAFDGAAGANGTSTNPSAGAVITTADGAIGFAVCASGLQDFDPSTPSHTGFGTGTGTPLGTFDDGPHGGGQQYALQATLGTITLGWTASSDDWGCVAAFFKEVPPVRFEDYRGFQAGQGISVGEKVA